jgi:excinuclease ABC subunit C
MQRIRDESHRFANRYNELLLRKRMKESLLDDAPGMTPRKKMLLLHHFGSVARLKKARAKEIASIKGISEQWATTLLDFLLNN